MKRKLKGKEKMVEYETDYEITGERKRNVRLRIEKEKVKGDYKENAQRKEDR